MSFLFYISHYKITLYFSSFLTLPQSSSGLLSVPDIPTCTYKIPRILPHIVYSECIVLSIQLRYLKISFVFKVLTLLVVYVTCKVGEGPADHRYVTFYKTYFVYLLNPPTLRMEYGWSGFYFTTKCWLNIKYITRVFRMCLCFVVRAHYCVNRALIYWQTLLSKCSRYFFKSDISLSAVWTRLA
jgi:hypothetical protein